MNRGMTDSAVHHMVGKRTPLPARDRRKLQSDDGLSGAPLVARREDRVNRILSLYTDGLLTQGERDSKLMDLIGEEPPDKFLAALPDDVKAELIANVRSFLATPPEEICIVFGGTLALGVDSKRWYQDQIDQMNAQRPAMRELLACMEAKQ